MLTRQPQQTTIVFPPTDQETQLGQQKSTIFVRNSATMVRPNRANNTINVNNNEVYLVKRIASHRYNDSDRTFHYLVYWEGYERPTWEHEANLLECDHVLAHYYCHQESLCVNGYTRRLFFILFTQLSRTIGHISNVKLIYCMHL